MQIRRQEKPILIDKIRRNAAAEFFDGKNPFSLTTKVVRSYETYVQMRFYHVSCLFATFH